MKNLDIYNKYEYINVTVTGIQRAAAGILKLTLQPEYSNTLYELAISDEDIQRKDIRLDDTLKVEVENGHINNFRVDILKRGVESLPYSFSEFAHD